MYNNLYETNALKFRGDLLHYIYSYEQTTVLEKLIYRNGTHV
jgi:hypothetical protein